MGDSWYTYVCVPACNGTAGFRRYMLGLILGGILWYRLLLLLAVGANELTLYHLRKTAKRSINHVLKYNA